MSWEAGKAFLINFQPWFRVVYNHHFDDIKTKENIRIIQHSQPN